MKKSIKLFIIGSLLSSVAMAQQDSIRSEALQKAEYGRGISYALNESASATAVATAEKLSHRTSINPSNMLYGMIPGLIVTQNANNVWADGATLRVRGIGTLSSSAPLVLVDGFERSIDQLSYDEIESVSVLKDATATSLYGVRGANGVILVKTKRGTMSGPQIDFTYQFNFATPQRLPKMADGYTYAKAINEALANDGLSPRYSQDELYAFGSQTLPGFYPNVDWMDEALRNHSYGDNVNFSVKGGGKFVRYFTQLNFLDDRGILQPTEENDGYSTQFKYSKLNIRTNLDIDLSSTTSLQLNLLGNFSEHNRPGKTTDEIFNALYQVPSGVFPVKTNRGVWGGSTQYANNPIAYISGTGYSRSQSRTLFADINLTQDLSMWVKGLSFGVKAGIDNYASYWDNNTKNFGYEIGTVDMLTLDESYTTLRNEGVLNFTKKVGSSSNHFTFETRLDFEREWAKHQLNTTLLYSMDKTNNKGRNASRAFMDVVAQAHYVFNKRYLFDVSLSGSASSILEPGHRWGIFPAVGAGWLLSEESFLKSDWLNLLKLRASYGIAGRADYGVNLYKDLYAGGNSYLFKDTPTNIGGIRLTQHGIDGLTYEKSHKLNVGIDFSAFNRLSISIDGYYDHRTDILVAGSNLVSSVFGSPVPSVNNGVVNSYGVETSINWNDRIGKVNYQLGAQLTFNRNKIINNNEEYRPYDYLKRTGKSIGQQFGYEVEGIYRDQDEIDNREVKQYLSAVQPGDLKLKDQNGDKRIDQYDMVALGKSTSCPEIYYSFDLGAEYKGFGFYAMFQGVGNYSRVLNKASVYRPLISNNTISEHYYENRWTPETPDAKYPRLTTTGSENNYSTNSLWVADASFLKLRTLEVYYQLQPAILRPLKVVKKAKIFARGNDLFSVDKIDVADPETMNSNYPSMAQYTFGVNLTF